MLNTQTKCECHLLLTLWPGLEQTHNCWLAQQFFCIRKLLSTMRNASGMVARIVKYFKKHPNPLSCIFLKCQGRRTVVDAYCFRSQDFLLTALASLLFSKILWLPSPKNETCRSSETCDYDFFQPKPLSIFVLKCFGFLFSDFFGGSVALGFTFPNITPCSRSCLSARCPLLSVRPSREQTLPGLGDFFAYTS